MSLRIQLEVTTRCTDNCLFCPRKVIGTNRSLGDMSAEVEQLFLDRVEEAKADLTINFSGFGEPLLYPRCMELAKEIRNRRPDVKLELNTNGTLLDQDATAKILWGNDWKNLFDVVQISLSLPTKQLYEKFKSSNYRTVYENLVNFFRMKGSNLPIADIRLLHFKQTKDELRYALLFWPFQIGRHDALRVACLENWTGLIDVKPLGIEYGTLMNVCQDLRSNYLTVTKEGRVLACCYSIALPEGNPFEIGALEDDKLGSFLDNKKRLKLLDDQREGIYLKECQSCSKVRPQVIGGINNTRYHHPNWLFEKVRCE